MNDSSQVSSGDIESLQNVNTPLLGGALLRQAREAEGLDIATLAASLKIPIRKLEALEADRFDLLPDSVFVRALASSICRALKIDPVPILAGLPHSAAPNLKTDETGINTPFRVAGDSSVSSFFDLLSRPVVVAVLILLFGALAIVLLPLPQMPGFSTAPGAGGPAGKSSSTASVETGSVQVTLVPPSVQTPEVARSVPEAPMVVSSAVSLPLPLRSESAVGSLPPVDLNAGGIDSPVVFKARASSWVEVVDAKGVLQLRKTLADGEVVTASGALPLSVVVGRVDSMEVNVRGKPFDLTTVSKNNVARFEVR